MSIRLNTMATIDRLRLGFRREACFIATLVLLIGLIFYTPSSGYWRADDPSILWHALNSKGLRAFYDPNDWQKLSPANLTPWVTLSFKIDLWLGGLSPRFFYVHQLCSLAMVTLTAYALNRQWMPPVWAFLSVCMFLVGAPTARVVELLMTRHYLEGMLFAFLALLAFVHALRQHSMLWAFAGALVYALAVTAKEIYIPLVLVVLLIPPINNLKTRLQLASPFIGVAVLYIFWRRYMLGTMIGGYSDSHSLLSFRTVTGIVEALRHFPGFFFGAPWQLPTILFASVLAYAMFKRPPSILVSIALAVGVVGPLIPLTAIPGISGPDRYLFLFWFVVSFAYVLSIRIATSLISSNNNIQCSIGIPLCLLITTLAIFHTRDLEASRQGYYHEFDIQGRFMFESSKQQSFVPTQLFLNNFWYVSNLCEIKKWMGSSCPNYLIKGLPVNKKPEQLYEYDASKEAMVDFTSKMDEEIARIESIGVSRPLFVEVFVTEDNWIRWRFGPYDNGQYYIVFPELSRHKIPKTGAKKTLSKEFSGYIQYMSPDGWITSSPLLVVKKSQPVVWERTQTKTN